MENDPNRIIPVIVRHNAMVYSESWKLIRSLLPELTEEYLSGVICLSVVQDEAGGGQLDQVDQADGRAGRTERPG